QGEQEAGIKLVDLLGHIDHRFVNFGTQTVQAYQGFDEDLHMWCRVVAMFEEGQLYSPVTRSDDGAVVVHLGADHPGFNDPVYRGRRNEIAAGALAWESGAPVRHVDYTEAENEVWRLVSAELAVKHERYAVREFNEAKAAVGLPADHVPQLNEVTERLQPLT